MEAAIKILAKNLIDKLPDATTMDYIIHALSIQTKLERAGRQSGF